MAEIQGMQREEILPSQRIVTLSSILQQVTLLTQVKQSCYRPGVAQSVSGS